MNTMVDIDTIVSNGVIVVPIVIGLVQLFKNLSPSRFWKWSPVLAIMFATLITWLTKNYTYKGIFLSGVLIGLISSGLYSSVKTLATDSRKDEL